MACTAIVGCALTGGVARSGSASERSAGAPVPDAGPAAESSGGAAAIVAERSRRMASGNVTLLVSGASEAATTRAFEVVVEELLQMEAVLNEWRPDTALSAINREAGAWVASPAPLCEVVRASISWAEKTGGLFDPTWAALRDVWRFGTAAEAIVPARATVQERCALVSWRKVEIQPTADACRIRLARRGMQLGLGGVAKGWAVDRAVTRLRSLGFKDFLLRAGGDLYAAGRRGQRPWRVGIRDPRGTATASFAFVEVEDAAFSTSGDYEHFFLVEGVRYHHLIDPRTCEPSRASRSATVLARTALEAEFLTKATFIAGGAEGLALAERFGASAVLIGPANELHVSKALAPRLQVEHPPTP
jgi:FAD:protein FMN transferase